MLKDSKHLFTEKQQAIIDACEHLRTVVQTKESEEVWDAAYEAIFEEHDEYLKKEQRTYEDMYVLLYSLAATIEYFIKKEDVLRVGEGTLMLMGLADKAKQFPTLSDEEKNDLQKIVFESLTKARLFMYNTKHPYKQIKYSRTPDQKCLLCKKANATKTGSHLVSNFLIQRFFAYDGSSKRDKEVVESYSLTNDDYRTYIGHRVGGDVTEELLGHEMTDDEIAREEKKPNLLMRDYFFCPECENRFGVIETYYADILSGKEKNYPSYVPYLFWLSIVWRMSIGRLAIHMRPEHEQRVGKILDKALALKREQIDGKVLGHFAYRIGQTKDLKGETPSIVGIHKASIPYEFLIGDYAFRFYYSESAAKSDAKRHGLNMEAINTGKKDEVIEQISFIDFWLTKRYIMDSVYAHPDGYDGKSIQDLAQLRNYDDVGRMLKEIGVEGEEMPVTRSMMTHPFMKNIPASVLRVREVLLKLKDSDEAAHGTIIAESGYTQEEIDVIKAYAEKKYGCKLEELEIHQEM